MAKIQHIPLGRVTIPPQWAYPYHAIEGFQQKSISCQYSMESERFSAGDLFIFRCFADAPQWGL